MAEKNNESNLFKQRYEREKKVRREAENIAERVTAELYEATQKLERANDELADANRVLEGANQSIRDFVSIASHDLRGPISAVVGFASLMLTRWDEVSDEQKREFIAVIKRQSEHLTRLTDDLLMISRIEAGAVEAHIEEVVVARLLEQAAQDFIETESRIVVSCSDDLRALADPEHVYRIVSNYLSNALKYGKPPVEAEAHEAGRWVEVRVCDRGDGISADLVPRLFEKFVRGKHPANKQERGTGLGLSIVRGLARANGGDAWYEPTDHGACFGVRLPALRVA